MVKKVAPSLKSELAPCPPTPGSATYVKKMVERWKRESEECVKDSESSKSESVMMRELQRKKQIAEAMKNFQIIFRAKKAHVKNNDEMD